MQTGTRSVLIFYSGSCQPRDVGTVDTSAIQWVHGRGRLGLGSRLDRYEGYCE